jgi:hypothetical protein
VVEEEGEAEAAGEEEVEEGVEHQNSLFLFNTPL